VFREAHDLLWKHRMIHEMGPTYFLFSGQLFHEEASDYLAETAPPTERMPSPIHHHHDDPTPRGPVGEEVGDDDDDLFDDDDGDEDGLRSQPNPKPDLKQIPGPGAPFVPEHGTPDANPIDPRVFEAH
jgi:hypothetical protein